MSISFPGTLFHSRRHIDQASHGGLGEAQANLALVEYFEQNGIDYVDLGVMKDSNASGSDFAFLVRNPESSDWELVIGDNKDYSSIITPHAFENAQEAAQRWADTILSKPEAIQQLILSDQFPDLDDLGLSAEELLGLQGYTPDEITDLRLRAESGDPDGREQYETALDEAMAKSWIGNVRDAIDDGRVNLLATTSGHAELSEEGIARLRAAGIHCIRIQEREEESGSGDSFSEHDLEDDEEAQPDPDARSLEFGPIDLEFDGDVESIQQDSFSEDDLQDDFSEDHEYSDDADSGEYSKQTDCWDYSDFDELSSVSDSEDYSGFGDFSDSSDSQDHDGDYADQGDAE